MQSLFSIVPLVYGVRSREVWGRGARGRMGEDEGKRENGVVFGSWFLPGIGNGEG